MKLTYKVVDEKDYYNVSNSREFAGLPVCENDIQKNIDFTYEICFGKGYHRNRRTGGQYERKNGEKFCNTFQGKLAEIVLYNYFKAKNLESKEPDFQIYGAGIWDDADLEIKGKKINVKSASSQSNLLLLEKKDWNKQGQYRPNLLLHNGSTTQYDYFILVRIQPDLKKLFAAKRWLYSNEITKIEIEELIFNSQWKFDLAGYCSHQDFLDAIENENIIPQNSILNHYTKMDACNYIQSGDLNQISSLVEILNK